MRVFTAALAVAMSLAAPLAYAQASFLPANDARLRADVLLLADEGVISLPTNAWPIPAGDIASAVGRVFDENIGELALRAVLARVRDQVLPRTDTDEWRIRDVSITAGDAPLLRSYGTPARDAVELTSTGGVANDRWSVALTATGIASPDDGQHLRLDGTALTIRWGNWLFGANQVDRWWGPGWDGSLILSSNARPLPALSIDRLNSDAFDIPILGWLGPWRFSAFLGLVDENRPDVSRPLFMGMRVSFKPAQILEFGLSRSAQFCGKGRQCNAKTFWNVIAGNDNAGLRVAPEDEPGNQMAGMDMRVVSPFRSLPVALYGQFIGEDNSSNGIPQRYLGLFGLESWALLDSGSVFRARLEYANTNCKFASAGDNPDCAYRQGIFNAGYRYRGRNIGHTADSDSEAISFRVEWTNPSGDSLAVAGRRALLDRYGNFDQFNPLTFGPGKVESIEAEWSGRWFGQSLSLTGGYERRRQGGQAARDRPFGFVRWHRSLWP